MKRGELKLAERGENLAHKVKTTDGCRGEALGDRKKTHSPSVRRADVKSSLVLHRSMFWCATLRHQESFASPRVFSA